MSWLLPPDATPVHEALRLDADLRRADIQPFAWIVNQRFAASTTSDPCWQHAARVSWHLSTKHDAPTIAASLFRGANRRTHYCGGRESQKSALHLRSQQRAQSDGRSLLESALRVAIRGIERGTRADNDQSAGRRSHEGSRNRSDGQADAGRVGRGQARGVVRVGHLRLRRSCRALSHLSWCHQARRFELRRG
jgi:hypothetical protein